MPKREKDPNAPKRPMSAYFFFVADQREEAKKRGEHISRVAEWTKEVSGKWRELTDAQKKPFEAKAGKDKERYNAAMANYTPTGNFKKRGGKADKDPNKPKRAPSAYFMFLDTFRAKNKSKYTHQGGHKDLIRAAGAAWNDLSDEEKAPYQKKHEEAKVKYEAAMAAYTSGAKKPKFENGASNVVDDDDDEDEDDDEEEEEESDDE